jgi:hypothetical protein
MMGEIYLHKYDLDAAEKMYQKAILLQPEREKDFSEMLECIDYFQNNPGKSEFIEPFTGYYRFEENEEFFLIIRKQTQKKFVIRRILRKLRNVICVI